MYHPTQVKGHSRKAVKIHKGSLEWNAQHGVLKELWSWDHAIHEAALALCSLTYVVTGGETKQIAFGLRMEMISRGQDFQSN